jgi:PKD repeat protein
VDRVVRVTLKVTDVNDQSDDTFVNLTIKARTDPRPPPIAQATGTPTSISPGQSVAFSSAGSSAPSGSIASYNWGFDDQFSGSSNNSWEPNPSHTFFQPGTFHVTLTITDEVGLTATAPVTVTVTPLPVALPTANIKDQPPPAEFYAAASVSFDGDGSKDHNQDPVVGYEWDFGDPAYPAKGSGSNTTHEYRTPGTYTVRLTVEDSGGRKASTTQTVVVKRMDPPQDFRAIGSRPQIPCVIVCWFAQTGYMDFGWTKLTPGPSETLSVDIRIIRGTGVSPCWQNTVDRNVPRPRGRATRPTAGGNEPVDRL